VLKEKLTGKEKHKMILKDWGNTALELGKWILVLWLLWPIRNAAAGPVDFVRVAVGIMLFIIFAGKLFYDTVIMGILRQRRTSVKQDILSFAGIILVMSLVVGFLLLFVGYLVIELINMSQQAQEE
jgi:hypothetical protein